MCDIFDLTSGKDLPPPSQVCEGGGLGLPCRCRTWTNRSHRLNLESALKMLKDTVHPLVCELKLSEAGFGSRIMT